MTLAIVDATYRAAGEGDGISESRYTMPLANVPLIAHVIGGLAASGVQRARVVAAHGDTGALERALVRGNADGMPLEVVEAPAAAPRRAVLAELDAALSRDHVLLAPGDGLCPELLGEMNARFQVGDVDLVLAAAGSAAVGDAAARERLSDTAVVLGPRARSVVVDLLGSDEHVGDLTETLLHGDLRLAVCDGSDGWSYDGSTDALLAGNRRVLDLLPSQSIGGELSAANELHGRISIGHGVFASGCVIHGPVAIGDHAVLEDSYVGPFTSIGPSAIVSGAELDDSILLAGAEVRHPGRRLTRSLIGERARVGRSFALPRGLRVRLGPDSQVMFS